MTAPSFAVDFLVEDFWRFMRERAATGTSMPPATVPPTMVMPLLEEYLATRTLTAGVADEVRRRVAEGYRR